MKFPRFSIAVIFSIVLGSSALWLCSEAVAEGNGLHAILFLVGAVAGFSSLKQVFGIELLEKSREHLLEQNRIIDAHQKTMDHLEAALGVIARQRLAERKLFKEPPHGRAGVMLIFALAAMVVAGIGVINLLGGAWVWAGVCWIVAGLVFLIGALATAEVMPDDEENFR